MILLATVTHPRRFLSIALFFCCCFFLCVEQRLPSCKWIFCQVIVGENKNPHLFLFFFPPFYLITVFIRASVESANKPTLYESMMFHWIFIINLYERSACFCCLLCPTSGVNFLLTLLLVLPWCQRSDINMKGQSWKCFSLLVSSLT